MNEKTDFAVETDKNKKESNLLQIKADDPNKETLLALLESESISQNPDTIGYTNVEDEDDDAAATIAASCAIIILAIHVESVAVSTPSFMFSV